MELWIVLLTHAGCRDNRKAVTAAAAAAVAGPFVSASPQESWTNETLPTHANTMLTMLI